MRLNFPIDESVAANWADAVSYYHFYTAISQYS